MSADELSAITNILGGDSELARKFLGALWEKEDESDDHVINHVETNNNNEV